MKQEKIESGSILTLISVFWKWRKYILGITFLAAIVSAIICLCLDNYYKATTSFYPANPDLAQPNPLGGEHKNIYYYGNDHDLDRLFTIAKSTELKEHLIKEFDLYSNYGINPDKTGAQDKVEKKLRKLYKTIKTKYDALELSVEDKNPKISRDMANSARDKIEVIAQNLVKSSQKKLLNNYTQSIIEKERMMNIVNDSLSNLKEKYGIYDFGWQNRIVLEQKANAQNMLMKLQNKMSFFESNKTNSDSTLFYKGLANNYSQLILELNEDLERTNKGYNQAISLEKERNAINNQLSLDKERLKLLKGSYDQAFQSIIIVDEARTPIVKSRPKRSIYVLISSLFAFIFSCFVVLAVESYKDIDWKSVING